MADSANPWGTENPIDLSQARLSINQKAWLGTQLASGTQTLKQLNSKYHIHKKTLSTYKRKSIKGLRIRIDKGRPPILDEEAKSALRRVLVSQGTVDEDEFRRQISEKHQETWARTQQNYSIYNSEPYRCISPRSIGRYLVIFRSQAETDLAAQRDIT
jgi:hypothetical protein